MGKFECHYGPLSFTLHGWIIWIQPNTYGTGRRGIDGIRTPKGIYCYKVVPLGLKNTDATYQKTMQRIFDDMFHKNDECYIDDLVVNSKKRENHFHDLRMVFSTLKEISTKDEPF
ncbi:UNVERIFIED_CONTAM: hypothetical protein Sradi_5840400 [Sesamum radiatum]|uniref:Reverse transcriptase domain-containing protein n=1 Tax=Sesamum radiatum TaxID=300843 RepID=A0AAW2KTD5_SESRA